MLATRRLFTAAATTFVCVFFFNPATAAILTVGPGRMFASPAAAASAASAGDTIQIYTGTYAGANFKKPNLTIVGIGSVVISGAQVLGKGLFVIDGANTTIQNITFKGAHNTAGNGAGIRAEATGLSVVNSRFYGNQDGILTANDPTITLAVSGSTFNGNGACAGACAHAIYAGLIASLTVTNTTLTNTQKGHDIKSRARATTLIGNTITDGTTGTSSYLVDIPNGGLLTMTGNILEKGAKSSNYSIAVSLGEEGATNPAGPMLIANNSFRNDGRPTTFVMNRTGYAGLLLSNNVLSGNKTTMLVGKGSVSAPGAANVALNAMPGGPNGASPTRFAALADPVRVPEASSWMLVLAGLLRLFAVWRGRKRQRAA